MEKIVLISHYSSNLEWLEKIKQPFVIYSKSIKNDNFINFNKGQEVPMYLKFIIDWYDKLPEKILFYHDHLNSPHQDFDSVFIINNLNWNLDSYFSVNKREWYQTIDKNSTIEPEGINWIKNNWNIFEKINLSPIDSVSFYSGAQFVLDKNLILQYNKSYYEFLYEWIQKTDLSNYITSRIFEYMWHYLFTNNPIEKQYENSNLYFTPFSS
jgi:hypothetical protein